MDIIYNIQHFGENKFLFNYTVNSDTPVFSLVLINPWTAEEKTATINSPNGTDGEWILNITGVTELREDLNVGKVHFENAGTWKVSISESGVLIKDVLFQVVQLTCIAYEDVLNYAISKGYSSPTEAQQIKQEALVCSLVAAGIWSSLDVFYVFRNTTKEMASVNYKNPGIFDLPLTGSRAISDSNFEADLGIIGVNSPVQFAIGGTFKLIQLENYSQNDASRFCWIYGHNDIISQNQLDRDDRVVSPELWDEIDAFSINSLFTSNTLYDQQDGVLRHIKRGNAVEVLDYENTTETSFVSASRQLRSGDDDVRSILALGEAKLAIYGIGAALENSALFDIINDFIN